MVIEFLEHIYRTIKSYFNGFNENIIKEHFVTIYQILEEMVDNGDPSLTEISMLKSIIPPPTILTKVMNSVQIPKTLITGKIPLTPSKIPWRREGIKYGGNEMFLDLNEEINIVQDCCTDTITRGYIKGTLLCDSKLSGMPEVRLTLKNSRILEDQTTCFHPCVRYAKFLKDRVLSFIPPDGSFKLMEYTLDVSAHQSLPVYIKPQYVVRNGEGKLDVSVTVRKTNGKDVEDLVVNIAFPNNIQNLKINSITGINRFDQDGKKVTWTIGNVTASPASQTFLLTASFTNPDNSDLNEYEKYITANFRINMYTFSGLRVDTLNVVENYTTYKGFRSIARAGQYVLRL
jgi:AP-3 complex subunit mu